MIKLVATDMDGTLLNSQKELPPDFTAWVERHPEIRVVIASGRQYHTLYEAFGGVRDRLIFIAENGNLVFEGERVLYKNVMAEADILRCIRTAEALPGVTPILCGVRSAWTVHAPPQVEREARMYYRRLTFTGDLAACVREDEIVKIALYIEGYRAGETVSRFQGIGAHLRPVVSGPDWIDISNDNASKGAALRSIREHYGIRREECMGFGDYMNDYELLQECGESYAMANACQELRESARYTTASNDEDGVMRVLRTLDGPGD